MQKIKGVILLNPIPIIGLIQQPKYTGIIALATPFEDKCLFLWQ